MNRRARIKGIANIPVRRKTEASNEIKTEPTVSPEKEKPEDKPQENEAENIKTESIPENNASTEQTNNQEENKTCDTTSETSKNDSNVSQTISRRWIPKPKPIVKNPSMLRRPKPVLLPLKEKSESVINQNIENENPKTNLPVTEDIKSPPVVQTTVVDSPEIHESITEPERTLQSPLSPNKILNRARIRPTPKLIRRNSVQGSASESEDDGRRSRIRNDSVCSTTSYTTEVTVKESTTISKDKLVSIKVHKLFRRSEQSRKVAEARRDFYHKFGASIPDRKRLTMMDLIYYNPVSNPMPPRKQSATVEEVPVEEPINVEEEKEDDPEEPEEDETPVPQVKVGPNGEIILDEQSLVIEQTGTKKGREKLANSQVVNVDDLDRAYGVYKRPKRSKDWSTIETLRFYRSLNTVGTDFSLMVSLFPGRTRRELKMKFKKEEKINRQLIDKALTNPLDFDLSELEKQLHEEEELIKKMEEEDKLKKSKKREPRKRYKKTSKSALEMEEELDLIGDIETEKIPKRSKRPPKPIKDRYSALTISEITTSESEPSEDEFAPKKHKKMRYGKRDTAENSKELPDVLLNAKTEEKRPQHEEISQENEENNNDDNAKKDICEDIADETTETEEITETTEIEETTTNIEDINLNCAISNILPNDLSTVEPGSLMILSSVGPDGEQVFKVFMVTPGQNKVPINLSDDVVQSLTNSLGSAQAVTLDLPVINEDMT